MPLTRTTIILAIVAASLGAASAFAAYSPLLSQGAFIYTGWHFGYSAFGTGHF